MTNRFRQGLHNQLYEKQDKLKKKQELNMEDLMKKERLTEIEEEINNLPLMTEDEFEHFETRIEQVKV